jgi:hypothetical protein
MRNGLLAGAIAAAALLGAAQAQSASIVGLFNTGVDDSNVALATFGGEDTHYEIISTSASSFALGSSITYEHPSYVAGDGDSKWISGNATGLTGSPSSTTTYRLSFSLTGLDPLSAVISGNWGTDNEGTIFLNGVNTLISLTGSIPNVLDGGDFDNFTRLHAFSISSGFVAGLNTLDFVILDTGPPSAMRVDDLAGTANAVIPTPTIAVPEPASWALMLVGFFGLGGALRTRRRLGVA